MKNLSKILSLVLTFAFLFTMFSFSATAELITSGTCGKNLTWTMDSDGVLIISGVGDMYDYWPINNTPWSSFLNDIKFVVIESGVTSVGEAAFMDCENLVSVTLPDGIKSIDGLAFDGCSNLELSNLPDDITHLGKGVFSGTPFFNDESNWEDGVLYMGEYLLESDTINTPHSKVPSDCVVKDGTTVIADGAFYNGIFSSVTFPDSLITIGSSAFYGCHGINEIFLPNGVKTIGASAFTLCSNLESITMPDSITSIGSYAFYNCALKSLSIPEGVKSIELRTFYGCDELESVTFSEGLEYIGTYAFYGCEKLESLVIPKSVTSIDTSAFRGCNKLDDIKLHDGLNYIGYGAFIGTAFYNDDSNWKDGALYIGNHLIRGWNSKLPSEYKIKEGTITLAASAFYQCNNLESVIFPESVVNVGDWALSCCENLLSVNMSDGVERIGDFAFCGSMKLKSLTVPLSVSSIGLYSMGYWSDEGTATPIKGFTLYGVSDSKAEEYALAHGFSFVTTILTPNSENEVYLDSNNNIMPNVREKTEASVLVEKLSKYGIKISIKDKNGKTILKNEKVGTSCKVSDENGNLYTVIVNGDVDGTGEINATDYLQIKKMFLGDLDLENEYLIAADTDGDGAITSTDYLQIKKYFLGQFDLYA